jgi:hypothetical protein
MPAQPVDATPGAIALGAPDPPPPTAPPSRVGRVAAREDASEDAQPEAEGPEDAAPDVDADGDRARDAPARCSPVGADEPSAERSKAARAPRPRPSTLYPQERWTGRHTQLGLDVRRDASAGLATRLVRWLKTRRRPGAEPSAAGGGGATVAFGALVVGQIVSLGAAQRDWVEAVPYMTTVSADGVVTEHFLSRRACALIDPSEGPANGGRPVKLVVSAQGLIRGLRPKPR